MFRRLMVCLALLNGAEIASAQPTAPGAAVAPQPASAMQLARLLNPEDRILAASDRAFKAGFEAALTSDQQTASLMKEHPALLDSIFARALPVVAKHVAASMPSLHRKTADFYASRFTVAEIGQLISFYGSPTGSKLVAGMYAGLDMTKIVDAVEAEGKDPFSGDALKGVIGSAAVGVLPSFDQADWKILIDFAKSPLFIKVRAATPDMIKMTTEIANEPNPELDAELDQLISRRVEDYFAKADGGGGG